MSKYTISVNYDKDIPNDELSRRVALNAQQDAPEKIKHIFGFNIEVNPDSNLGTLINMSFTGVIPRDETNNVEPEEEKYE